MYMKLKENHLKNVKYSKSEWARNILGQNGVI